MRPEEVADLHEPNILVHDRPLPDEMGTLPFLEWIVQSGKPFVFVGDGVGQSLLQCLVLNKQRGSLKVAAVRVRGSAEHRKAILEEIASITGGLVFNDDLGVEFNQITLREIGTAKRVLIGKDKTVVFSRKRDDVRPQGGEPSDDRNSHDSQPRQAGAAEDQSAAGFASANGEPIPRSPEDHEQLREALVPNSSGTPSSPNQPAGMQMERLQRGPPPLHSPHSPSGTFKGATRGLPTRSIPAKRPT